MDTTIYTFKKYLNTNDPFDFIPNDDQLFLIWAYHKDSKSMRMGHTNQGKISLN